MFFFNIKNSLKISPFEKNRGITLEAQIPMTKIGTRIQIPLLKKLGATFWKLYITWTLQCTK